MQRDPKDAGKAEVVVWHVQFFGGMLHNSMATFHIEGRVDRPPAFVENITDTGTETYIAVLDMQRKRFRYLFLSAKE